MRWWIRCILAFPIAYLGGTIVFGMLASGSWITVALGAMMQPWAFDWLLLGLTWITRIGILWFLFEEWVQAR